MAFAHIPCYDIMEQVGKIVLEKRAEADRKFQLGLGDRVKSAFSKKSEYKDKRIQRTFLSKCKLLMEIRAFGKIHPSQYKTEYWRIINRQGKDVWEYKDWRKNNPRKRIKSSMPKETRETIYYKSIGILNRVGIYVNESPEIKYIISK